jgi:uncharacterized protein DUF3617
MRPSMLRACAVVAAATLLMAAAWSHGKPGLWSVTTRIEFTKGGPQIPPEQLAKMKEQGMKLPFGQPVTISTCVTPEQAAREELPKPQQRMNDRCQMQNLTRAGSTFTADMVCDGEMRGTGHLEVTYQDDEHYAGTLHFVSTSKRGGEVDMTDTISGRWLGADCGSVKPMGSR